MPKFHKYSELRERGFSVSDIMPRCKGWIFIALDTEVQYTPSQVCLVSDTGLRTACSVSLQYRNEKFYAASVIIPSNIRKSVYHLVIDDLTTEDFLITNRVTTEISLVNRKTDMGDEVPLNVINPHIWTTLTSSAIDPKTADVSYDDSKGSWLPLSSRTWNERKITVGPLSASQISWLNAVHYFDNAVINTLGQKKETYIKQVSFSDNIAELTILEKPDSGNTLAYFSLTEIEPDDDEQ